MKNIILLITVSILFIRCGREKEIHLQPTGTYDTLGVQWTTIERNNMIYYFQGEGEKGPSLFTDLFEEAYEQLDPIFNAQLPRKLRFFVWTDWDMAERVHGHSLSFAVGIKCECHVSVSHPLGHEITHILEYWSGGNPRNTYSKFITEGVAVAFDLEKDDKMKTARQAIVNQSLGSIRDLWLDYSDTAPDELLYPVAGAFIDYIYKLKEPDKFKLLIKNQTLEDAELIYGKERLDALIADFDSELGLG